MLHVVVDAANVVGSRPDGWWRDRPGAARRLAARIVAGLAAGPEGLVEALDGPAPGTAAGDPPPAAVRVHLVLEGAAKAAADLPAHPLLDVVHAARDGDAAIAELAAALARPGRTSPDRVLVVTADRGLRERVRSAGADVTGPGALLDALPGA